MDTSKFGGKMNAVYSRFALVPPPDKDMISDERESERKRKELWFLTAHSRNPSVSCLLLVNDGFLGRAEGRVQRKDEKDFCSWR